MPAASLLVPPALLAAVAALRQELERVEGRLANPQFVAKAPAEVVEKERARAEELREAVNRVGEAGLPHRPPPADKAGESSLPHRPPPAE